MYLLYIDDSGTCELKNNESYILDGTSSTRYFVLGAILIKAHTLNAIQGRIENLRQRCLHDELSEIKFSPNRKLLNCKHSCALDYFNIDCHRSNIAQLISEIDCKIFACAQDKYFTTTNNIVSSKLDVYQLSFEHLLKLVDTFMYDNKIGEDVIVFIDHKDEGTAKDDLIYKAYRKALNNTKIYKSFGNGIFSPTINVVSSRYTVGAQLADFVAGATWKFCETLNNTDEHLKVIEFTNMIGRKSYVLNGKSKSFTYCKNWLK